MAESILVPHTNAILADFKDHPSCNALAKKYGVTYAIMWGFFKRHGLKSSGLTLLPAQQKALATDHASGMRPKELAIKYGIPKQTAQDYALKFSGVKLPQYRKKVINESFFDTLTEESLWVLGWFYSDGNVHSVTNKFSVTVHSNDIEVLRLIGKTMGFEEDSIYCCESKNACEMYGNHPRIHSRLIELGCVPNKSLIITYPTFFTESWQHWAFLRGVLEGDGHLGLKSKHNRCTFGCEIASGSRIFVEGIKSFLDTQGIESYVHSHKKIASKNRLIVGEREHAIKFLDEIYKDGTATLYLDRKFKIYLQMKEIAARPHNWVAINRHRHIIAYFRSPDGTIYHVNGIRPFAREMGISHAILRPLLKPKKWRSAKHGWSAATEDQIAAARANGTLVTKIY